MNDHRFPLAVEEPPYRRLNPDGRLGCYEVAGVLSVVLFAHRSWISEGPGVEAPEVHELRGLVRYLVSAVDAVQARVAGRVDWMAASSDRAWRAVRTAIAAHPVPWGADSRTKEAWWHGIVDHAAGLFALALEFVDDSDHYAGLDVVGSD